MIKFALADVGLHHMLFFRLLPNTSMCNCKKTKIFNFIHHINHGSKLKRYTSQQQGKMAKYTC